MTAAKKLSALWKKELDTVRRRNGGILRVQDVVDYARDPATALHKCFEWDDRKGAEQYRLWQARELVRSVYVEITPGDTTQYNAYVSMNDDRKKPGGGYRLLASVLSDKEQRRRLLVQALSEFDLWKQKYDSIKELAGVFEARKKIV